MTFLMIISVIIIYPDDSTFFLKCDMASDLWQQLDYHTALYKILLSCLGWSS